ncbi:patatin-like phospholipase family protein [Jatrophihabitans sp.]|uniref:patatin-like phospholipase family protein n=1 Tax=Jatrophihabitans sp. TaxID=1932789 RepID=UPI0030C73FAA|nr:Patatin [Jatrophihabitans sp.]
MSESTAPGSVASEGLGVSEPVTAFVFQGGGSLSAPQVGMLRALTEAGIRPDLVIGSSAGALNAVAYATDPTPRGLNRLEELWLTLRWRNVARLSLPVLARALVGRRDGLLDASPLIDLLSRGMVAPRLEETGLPAHVVATDLMTAAPVVLSQGDSVTALLASSAFPGIYAPVPYGSQQLIDGGVSADIPVLQAEALGAQRCYVLPAAISDDTGAPPHGPLAMAYHALGQILDATARRDASAAQGEVHLLPAATSPASNPLDFRESRRLINDGYTLASRWLTGASEAVYA